MVNESPDDEKFDLSGLKDVWKNAQKDRFKQWGEWVFDRWIFTTAMLLIFGWLLFVAWSYDFQLDYYNCIEPGGHGEYYMGRGQPVVEQDFGCKNPFYKPMTWKNSQYLLPGEYGTKLGPLFKSIYHIPFVVLGAALGLNHWLHNKKWRR